MSDAKKITVNGTEVNFKDNYAREQITKNFDGFLAGAYAGGKFYRLTNGTELEKKDNYAYLDVNTFSIYAYDSSEGSFYEAIATITVIKVTISSFAAFVNLSFGAYSRKIMYYYRGATTEYMTHGYFYEAVKETVTPTGTENPHSLAWAEHISGDTYYPTSDTTVKSGKTYYTIKLKSIKTQDDNFTPELQAKLEAICNGYYIGAKNGNRFMDLKTGNELPKEANTYYLDIPSRTLFKYVGSSFELVNGSCVDIFDNISNITEKDALADRLYADGVTSIRYMGTTSMVITHGYFYEIEFVYAAISLMNPPNPAEEGWYEYDSTNDVYFKTEDTENVSAKVYYVIKLTHLKTQADVDISSLTNRVTFIESYIPSNASASNKFVTQADVPDLTDVVRKSNVSGLLRNNGTVDESPYVTLNDLGTAATKDFTTNVAPNNHSLVESNAVYAAIGSALSSIYTPRGNKTAADLTSDLLTEDHKGDLYNITTSGTTTDLFIGGTGRPINIGDTVSVVQTGPTGYKFNLMPGLVHMGTLQTKDLDTAVSVSGANRTTVEAALAALAACIPSDANGSNKVLTNATLVKYVAYSKSLASGATSITDSDVKSVITTLLNDYHLVDDLGFAAAGVSYGNVSKAAYIFVRETLKNSSPGYCEILEMNLSGSNDKLRRCRATYTGGAWSVTSSIYQYLRSDQVVGSAIEGSSSPVASNALYKMGMHTGSLVKNSAMTVELKSPYTCYYMTIQVAGQGGIPYCFMHNGETTGVKNLWTGHVDVVNRNSPVTITNGITVYNSAWTSDRIQNSNDETELIWVSGPISRVEIAESQVISG